MNAAEARRRRRARRRGLLAIALVGGAGIAGVVMTFVPWIHGPAHQVVTGWDLFQRFGVVLRVYGDDDAFSVFTGITTLIGGAILVADAVVLAATFDPEVRGDFGFLAFADGVVTPVRVLAAVAAVVLVLTGSTHLLVGLTWTGLASFVLALLGEVGVSVVTLPRTV